MNSAQGSLPELVFKTVLATFATAGIVTVAIARLTGSFKGNIYLILLGVGLFFATYALTDYVLVSQAMPLVEHYRRQSNNEWVLAAVGELEGNLQLASID